MILRDFTFDRKFVVTGGALLLALLLFVFFPATDRLSPGTQGMIAFFVFFLLFPMLYAKFVLKESWRGLGFQMDQSIASWMMSALTAAFGFLIFFFAYRIFPALHDVSRLPFSVERSFFSFVQYELFLLGTLFFYEVFFRGFVMLLFLRRFGLWSVFLQWGVFLLFLFGSGSFGVDQALMMLFAPLAGMVAYRSQSLGYSFFASGIFFFSVDIFLLLANR